MKFLIILLTLLMSYSCQDTNSNSDDRVKYGPVDINETDPNFRPAYNVIMNRCVNCHDGYHNSWANLTSNADWLAEYIVIKNNAAQSIFIQRIINSGVGQASSMPLGGSKLPDSEYETLVNWINLIP